MVDLHPFNALKYDPYKVKDLSFVISPPYDIISQVQKKELKELSKYNIVNLILPEGSNEDRYENASRLLMQWSEDGVLIKDEKKSIYLFEERYFDEDKLKKITGIIGLIRIEDYQNKAVLRHEKTLSKPRQDRLELLRRCRTNFGLIYTLYEDKKALIKDVIEKKLSLAPDISVSPAYDKNLSFNIWTVSDEKDIGRISKAMKDKSILIADGHHRYETSRIYMHEVSSEEPDSPEKFVLVLLMDMDQDDIELLATHRLVKFTEHVSTAEIIESLKVHFDIVHQEKPQKSSINFLLDKMEHDHRLGYKSFLFCLRRGPAFIARLNKKVGEIYRTKDDNEERYENLDVNILHRLVFGEILKDHNMEISFTHDTSQAFLMSKENKSYDMAVIVNAPDKKEVYELSLDDKLMPQKSTYFYPKPCSGTIDV
jgi:uncharacterized protein (DUF1015 family)